MFPKPCLDCQKLHSDGGDWCSPCRRERQRQQKPNAARKLRKAKLYNSEYQKISKLVRANAIQCHICKEGYRPTDPWTADHLVPGDPMSPLAPAHRSCNSRRGNKPLT